MVCRIELGKKRARFLQSCEPLTVIWRESVEMVRNSIEICGVN
jgi:hypothetical protein